MNRTIELILYFIAFCIAAVILYKLGIALIAEL
jgi:hypothetical protein